MTRYPTFDRILVATLAAFVLALALVWAPQTRAQDLQAEGKAAVDAWIAAVVSGDAHTIDAILAPEFQIVRADGTAYDKAAYVASNLPRFPEAPAYDQLVVTGDGGRLVARYQITTNIDIGNEVMHRFGPRLTVFRKDGDAWLVVAHANFATIER